jgi:hypothetical protein
MVINGAFERLWEQAVVVYIYLLPLNLSSLYLDAIRSVTYNVIFILCIAIQNMTQDLMLACLDMLGGAKVEDTVLDLEFSQQ